MYSDNPLVDPGINRVVFSNANNLDIKLIIGRPNINWGDTLGPGVFAVQEWRDGVQTNADVSVLSSVKVMGDLSCERAAWVKAEEVLGGRISSRSGSAIVEALTVQDVGIVGASTPGVYLSGGELTELLVAGDFFGLIETANNASIDTIFIGGDFFGEIQHLSDGRFGLVNVSGHFGGEPWSDYPGGLLGSRSDVQDVFVGNTVGVKLNSLGQLELAPAHFSTWEGGLDPSPTWSQLEVGEDFIGDFFVFGSLLNANIHGAFAFFDDTPVPPGEPDDHVWGQLYVRDIVESLSIGNAVWAADSSVGAMALITLMNTTAETSVSIAGDYRLGFIRLFNGLHQDALVSIGGNLDAPVGLGEGFDAGAEIYIAPSDGLHGQLVVNANNSASEWDGDVLFGSVTRDPVTFEFTYTEEFRLSGPELVSGTITDEHDYTTFYTELSSELGGGHVGKAPYNFHQRMSPPPAGHQKDCDPYQGETKIATFDSETGKNEVINSVKIHHYGPVYVEGSGPHFVVEFKRGLFPSTWVDRTNLFTVETINDTIGTNPGNASRDVVLKGNELFNATGFTAAGQWRVRPIEGKVKCADADGNPDVAWFSDMKTTDSQGNDHYWYRFNVLLQGPNETLLLQGGTSTSDVSAWIEAPYEVNADGETNATDFVEVAESLVSE